MLKDKVNRPAVGCHAGHVGAADAYGAGAGFCEARDHPQQRGLAASGRSEDGKKVALGHLEGDAVDGRELAKGLGDVFNGQVGLHGVLHLTWLKAGAAVLMPPGRIISVLHGCKITGQP